MTQNLCLHSWLNSEFYASNFLLHTSTWCSPINFDMHKSPPLLMFFTLVKATPISQLLKQDPLRTTLDSAWPLILHFKKIHANYCELYTRSRFQTHSLSPVPLSTLVPGSIIPSLDHDNSLLICLSSSSPTALCTLPLHSVCSYRIKSSFRLDFQPSLLSPCNTLLISFPLT